MNTNFKNWLVKPPKRTGAKLKGTVATVASLCIVCTVFIASLFVGGCNEKLSPPDEPEIPAVVPDSLVAFEKLPKWLQDEIKTFENERLSGVTMTVHRGYCEGHAIYFVHNDFMSCTGYYYYEDGVLVVLYENGDLVYSYTQSCIYSGYKNWPLIYKIDGPRTKNNLNVSTNRPVIKDKYEFPIKPGTPEWGKIKTITERVKALQIPDAVLSSISTDGLLETCLEFPFLVDIFFYDNYQRGFEELKAEFNGFREFLNDLICQKH